MTEWDASHYARISALQKVMADEALGLLNLNGSERVIDVGCGDGKITAEVAARVPSGFTRARRFSYDDRYADCSHSIGAWRERVYPRPGFSQDCSDDRVGAVPVLRRTPLKRPTAGRLSGAPDVEIFRCGRRCLGHQPTTRHLPTEGKYGPRDMSAGRRIQLHETANTNAARSRLSPTLNQLNCIKLAFPR